MGKNDIGLIGCGVMGGNLALNIESKGFSVAVFDIDSKKIESLLNKAKGKRIKGSTDLQDLVNSLKIPKKIMLMIPAGAPVDSAISSLLPFLNKGDIIIDGGNSFFKDTIRRVKELEQKGYLYIGTGVSGGEEGALKGPAIMPGGSEKGWLHIKPIFEKISAKANDDVPCCKWIGPDGAGHFVKVVHNGIEYADMQLICEAYFLLSNLLGMNAKQISEIFFKWNQGELQSYLIEITGIVLSKKDPDTQKPIVDIIMDKAGQKGTGAWTSQIALELGVPAPTIAEAVFARCLAAIKDERINAAKIFKTSVPKKYSGNRKKLIEKIRKSLYVAKICVYAQGFAMMKVASESYNWKLNFSDISSIWRAGCIIRARFLNRINDAYTSNPTLKNILLDKYFKKGIYEREKDLREVVSLAVRKGISIPAFSSALSYLDGYRSKRLPANLLQAQRDYFGAHTYERIDKPGKFHSQWDKLENL